MPRRRPCHIHTMKKLLIFGLVALLPLACEKANDQISPAISCKLTQAVVGNYGSGTYDFTYDDKGNIIAYSLTTMAGPDKQVLTHTLTYDAAGQLVTGNQTFSINGKAQGGGGNIAFTYTNGLLTGQTYSQAGSTTPFASATLTYDASKRITSRVYVNNSDKYNSTQTYGYDANGNCTSNQFIDSDGYKEEIISTYDTSKSPEQILMKSIPYDFASARPWNLHVALTEKDTFDDGTGPVVLAAKRTNVRTDASGYVTGTTYTGDTGTISETYSLSNCN